MHQKLVIKFFLLCCMAGMQFAFGQSAHPSPVHFKSCIVAAKNVFELFEFDAAKLEATCTCAANRLKATGSAADVHWEQTGRNSPVLALVECGKNDIASFYQKAALISAATRLRKQGFSETNIIDFSQCAGLGGYEGIRRVAAASYEAAFDKARFREMYKSCEQRFQKP